MRFNRPQARAYRPNRRRSTRPDTVRVILPRTRSKSMSRVMNDVTPEQWRRAKRAAESGEPGDLFAILDFYESYDTEIPSALESLISAVAQGTLAVVPDDEESDEAMEQAELVDCILRDLDTQGLIEELAYAHYYPARCVWLSWSAYSLGGRSYQAPVTYELLPDSYLYAKQVGGSGPTVMHVGDQPYHAYPHGSLLLHTSRKLPSFQDINFTRFGRGIGVCRLGVYTWYDIEDWAAYNEVFGVPTIVGTLLDGYGDKDERMLRKAVYGIASDSRAVKTERTKIETLEARGGNRQALFQSFAEYMDRAKSRLLKGESLTDNMGQVGSFAATRTANGIRVDVAARIAGRIEQLLNRHLLRPLADLNFSQLLCRITLKVSEARNEEQERKTDEFLIKHGIDLSRADLRRRYARPAPLDDDDTVSAAAGLSRFPLGS